MTLIVTLLAVPLYVTKSSEIKKIPRAVNSRFTCTRRNIGLKIIVDNEFCDYACVRQPWAVILERCYKCCL
jgi:hypothetical protein